MVNRLLKRKQCLDGDRVIEGQHLRTEDAVGAGLLVYPVIRVKQSCPLASIRFESAGREFIYTRNFKSRYLESLGMLVTSPDES